MRVSWLRGLIRRRGNAAVLLAGLVLLCAAFCRKKRRVLLLLAAVLLALCWFGKGCRFGAPGLRVTFLDVGKGDAIVVETPSGKTLVVDTGGMVGDEDRGKRTIAPYLEKRGIKKIDALLLTHPHPDHISGTATLLERFAVGGLFDNGTGGSDKRVRQYRSLAEEKGVPYRVVTRGETLDLGRGVSLTAVSPPKNLPVRGVNNGSIVLRLQYGNTVFLLTGDAETDSEAEMLKSGQSLGCDVLKVAHHGSRASTSPGFVAAAHPRIAVISVSSNNRSGYPHREILDRLERSGARIYRTDRNGPIVCLTDGSRLRVETAR